MSDAPTMPPGEERLHAGVDAIAVTLRMTVVFLAAGALAVGSGAYIAAELHSPRGEPIFGAGAAGLATGVALALMARLR